MDSWQNLLERALWTGVQSALALLSADALGVLDAAAGETLIVAGFAMALSALKTFSQGRLRLLEGGGD